MRRIGYGHKSRELPGYDRPDSCHDASFIRRWRFGPHQEAIGLITDDLAVEPTESPVARDLILACLHDDTVFGYDCILNGWSMYLLHQNVGPQFFQR